MGEVFLVLNLFYDILTNVLVTQVIQFTSMKKYSILLCLTTFSFISLACIWDEDTIEMERQRFPNTLEIISGKFLRHSPEFYQWRIKDREAKLKAIPKQWNYYDDLAVAYDKIGNHAKAIELMLQKETLHPGQYETYANLGTFYIHYKQYQKGLQYIDKAIKINPNAHFGREVYQKYLVEYALTKVRNGKMPLPLDTLDFAEERNYYWFVKRKMKQKFDPKAAIKGVMGMIKFGNQDSPILFEALGDLLEGEFLHESYDGTLLASLAYKKAATLVKSKNSKTRYLKRISVSPYLNPKDDININSLESTEYKLNQLYKDYLEQAQQLYQQIRNDEVTWIKEGKNPEEEFAKKYYENSPDPTATFTIREKPVDKVAEKQTISLSTLAIALGAGLLSFLVIFAISKKKS